MGELIELKPGIGPFRLNVSELIRRLKPVEDPVLGVAQRFIQLFLDHGVAIPEIQHFLPLITLDKLSTLAALLPELTNDVLDHTAMLFGVQRQWLDGTDTRIYKPLFCYKDPAVLFRSLGELSSDKFSVPLRVLYCEKPPCSLSKRYQPLAIVLVETVRTLGEREICRYRVFGDEWDWSYEKCRIQMKAMVRALHLTSSALFPLYRVEHRVLRQVLDGDLIPRAYLQGSLLTEPSLEDYALSEAECAVAQEVEELPAVLLHSRLHGIVAR